MKRSFFIISACLGILLAVSACGAGGTASPEEAPGGYTVTSTADSAAPEALYQADPGIDLFVYGDASYVLAADLGWVAGLELEQGGLAGTIVRSGVTEEFQDWDATVLAEGCEVYTTDRNDILLACPDGTALPYLKWVEG